MTKLTGAQEQYFKDSKIKNPNGELITCYHYTKNTFNKFDKNRIGEVSGDNGYFGKGFYFTARKSFNSCCFAYDEKDEVMMLECYLNIKKPFNFDKLGKEKYGSDDYWDYDMENFLRYLKNNSEDGIRIVLSDDDLVAYIKDNYHIYEEYIELVDMYEHGEIGYHDKYNGKSLYNLYYELQDKRDIITPDKYYICFDRVHRGLLVDYSELITEYAKNYGFDGIISDFEDEKVPDPHPTEIVVFSPEQIKSIDNKYPTNSPIFTDNTKEYIEQYTNNYTDKGKILELLSKDAEIIKHIPNELLYDNKLIVEAIKVNHDCYNYLPNSCYDGKEIKVGDYYIYRIN